MTLSLYLIIVSIILFGFGLRSIYVLQKRRPLAVVLGIGVSELAMAAIVLSVGFGIVDLSVALILFGLTFFAFIALAYFGRPKKRNN